MAADFSQIGPFLLAAPTVFIMPLAWLERIRGCGVLRLFRSDASVR